MKGMIVIGSMVIFKGQVPQLTPEQKARLAKLAEMSDEDIDYSDIPPLRDDEVGKYKRLRDKPNLWKKIRVKIIEDNSEVVLMGEYSLEGLNFEWDDEKYQINIKKHGIRFETAARVFVDEYMIDDYDLEHSDEDRIKVIGKVEKVLVVIYTERTEKLRIISARLANKKERNDYYGQFSVN